jgi:hypothetical protein
LAVLGTSCAESCARQSILTKPRISSSGSKGCLRAVCANSSSGLTDASGRERSVAHESTSTSRAVIVSANSAGGYGRRANSASTGEWSNTLRVVGTALVASRRDVSALAVNAVDVVCASRLIAGGGGSGVGTDLTNYRALQAVRSKGTKTREGKALQTRHANKRQGGICSASGVQTNALRGGV